MGAVGGLHQILTPVVMWSLIVELIDWLMGGLNGSLIGYQRQEINMSAHGSRLTAE